MIMQRLSRCVKFRHRFGLLLQTRRSFADVNFKSTIFDSASITDSPAIVKRMIDRFLISASFPDTLLKDLSPLSSIPKVIYAGFDPTADSLHIGHLLIINALLHFYAAGFDVIALVGGATAKLGDPSGRLVERKPVDWEILAENTRSILVQLERIFHNFADHILATPHNRQHLKALRFVNNAEWYEDVNVIDFVAKIGPLFRLKHLTGKETVRSRAAAKEGMHFAEFSYQIFQAYDWLRLYEKTGCLLQIGGSDQIGNIHSGHDLIQKFHRRDAFGLVVPLLTGEKGEKLGKSTSAENPRSTIWLDPDKTSPFEFYQHFIRVPDAEIEKYLHLFTFLPLDTVESIRTKQARNPERKSGPNQVASQMTLLVHGPEGLASAQRCTDALYHGSLEKLSQLSEDEFQAVFNGVPSVDLPSRNDVTVLEVAMRLEPFVQAGDRAALETIRNGGFYVNYQKIREPNCIIVPGVHTLPNRSTIVRVGKRNYFLVRWR